MTCEELQNFLNSLKINDEWRFEIVNQKGDHYSWLHRKIDSSYHSLIIISSEKSPILKFSTYSLLNEAVEIYQNKFKCKVSFVKV